MSYFEESVEVVSLPSAADMSNTATVPGANRFVTLNSSGEAAIAGANAVAFGVMTTNQPQGAAGRVAINGIVPVLLSATVATGAALGAGANGTGTGAATTKLGIAVIGGVSGNVVPVKLVIPPVAAA